MKKLNKSMQNFILATMVIVALSKFSQIVYMSTASTYNEHISEMYFWGIMSLGFSTLYLSFRVRLKRYIMEQMQKLQNYRTLYYERKKSISTSYHILSLTPSSHQVLTLLVQFREDLMQDAMPKIEMDGMGVSLSYVTQNIASLHCKNTASATNDNIILTLGTKHYSFPNPFMIDLGNAKVFWQNQGNAGEKKIVLELQESWNIADRYILPFQILINGVLEYDPIGHRNGNKIVIPIGYVDKDKCAGKPCELRLSYDLAGKLSLPAPIVTSLNNKPVPIRESK